MDMLYYNRINISLLCGALGLVLWLVKFFYTPKKSLNTKPTDTKPTDTKPTDTKLPITHDDSFVEFGKKTRPVIEIIKTPSITQSKKFRYGTIDIPIVPVENFMPKKIDDVTYVRLPNNKKENNRY